MENIVINPLLTTASVIESLSKDFNVHTKILIIVLS